MFSSHCRKTKSFDKTLEPKISSQAIFHNSDIELKMYSLANKLKLNAWDFRLDNSPVHSSHMFWPVTTNTIWNLGSLLQFLECITYHTPSWINQEFLGPISESWKKWSRLAIFCTIPGFFPLFSLCFFQCYLREKVGFVDVSTFRQATHWWPNVCRNLVQSQWPSWRGTGMVCFEKSQKSHFFVRQKCHFKKLLPL